MSSNPTPSPTIPPAPPARVTNIQVKWDQTTHNLHSESDYNYPDGAPYHDVKDTPGWRYDVFLEEVAKLNPAVVVPGADPLVAAYNVARLIHDYEWVNNLPERAPSPLPPLTGQAPDIT